MKKPDFMTDEEWKAELEFVEKLEQKQKNLFFDELKDNPPLPPWKKFPDLGPVDMFWSMGSGESYLTDYVFTYFKYATSEELQQYKEKHPEPSEWQGWYKS